MTSPYSEGLFFVRKMIGSDYYAVLVHMGRFESYLLANDLSAEEAEDLASMLNTAADAYYAGVEELNG